MDVNETIKRLNLVIPPAPALGGVYAQFKPFGANLVYVSGCSPDIGDGGCQGILGKDMTTEQGQIAARNCMLNILAIIAKHAGDLNRVKNFVKLLGFVRCTADFADQPKVMNGASQLLIDVFGDEIGRPARSAIGTHALPGGISVEVEALIELKD